MTSDGLQALFDPGSIAVIGASNDPDKIGGRSIGYLRDYGYGGRVYPVNPNRDRVQGLPAYSSLSRITAPIDLAVIATPAARVLEELDACGQQGVRACVVLSSGFGELGEEGKDLERQIAETARRYSMRVLGPNCQGVANTFTGSIASFSTCFATHHLRGGALAIVSQSGAVAGMLSDLQCAHPEGIRYWAATGNEADVGVAELVHQALRDPAIRVVQAYCEHLQDAEQLAAAARYAAQENKAILMVKSGVTTAGTDAAGSHTGALAQDDAVVDAFLRHHGVVRANSLRQLTDYARIFAGPKRARGNHVAILTNSGGLGVMMADRCRDAGLELAELAPQTTKALAGCLPDFAATNNPIDVTAELLTNGRLLDRALPVLADDAGVDVVLVALGIVGRGYDVATITDDLVKVDRESEALLVVCWMGGDESAVEELSRQGVATFTDDAACLDAVGRFVGHCRRQQATDPGEDDPPGAGPQALRPTSPAAWTDHVAGTGFLSEYASKAVLRDWGLPVVRGRAVAAAPAAVEAARDLGYPVAVKLSSPEVSHKTELGLVVIDLETDADVHAAAETVLARGERSGVDVVDGVLVEQMAPGGVEMAIGARWDDTFGPVVLIAAGGVNMEAVADFSLVLPSASRSQIEEAIRSLAVYPVLCNARGSGPFDLVGLVDLVESFSRRLATAGPQLAEVDLNPVFVAPRGQGVSIADALIRLAPTTGAD